MSKNWQAVRERGTGREIRGRVCAIGERGREGERDIEKGEGKEREKLRREGQKRRDRKRRIEVEKKKVRDGK